MEETPPQPWHTQLWHWFGRNYGLLLLAWAPWLVALVVWLSLPRGSAVIQKVDSGSQAWVLAQVPDLPDSLVFASEAIPLKDPELIERYERELLSNLYYQSNTLLLLKRANRWFPIIEPIIKEYNLPDDLKYVAVAESYFENRTSHRGAAGFWQFMPVAGKEFGLEVTDEVDERLHLVKATHAACKYFRRTKKQLGNFTSALASYNMGPAGYYGVMQRQQMTSYYDLLLNPETSRYVFRVLAMKALLSNPKAYGYHIKPEQLYQPFTLRSVRVTESIPDLASWAIAQGSNYKMLKYHNPWLLRSSLTVSPGRSYVIELPEKTQLNTNPDTRTQADSDAIAQDTAKPSSPDPLPPGPETQDPASNPDSSLPGKDTKTEPAPRKAEAPLKPASKSADKKENKSTRSASNTRENKREEPTKPREHVVKNGESLSTIAAKYRLSTAQLARLNKIKPTAKVQRGQKLRLR